MMTLMVGGLKASVKAATYPEKVRSYYDGQESIEVELDHYEDSIKNLKVDHKAKVFITSINKSQNSEKMENTQVISLYIPKTGVTYTVTFDVVNEKGKKIESCKFKVYCYDCPFKVTVDGKNALLYMDEPFDVKKKDAKVVVNTNKKNPITNLEYSYVTEQEEGSKDSDQYSLRQVVEFKKFKNGSKIKLNDKPDRSIYQSTYNSEYYSSSSYSEYSSIYARTYIRITYKDQYTGKKEQFYVYNIEKFIK